MDKRDNETTPALFAQEPSTASSPHVLNYTRELGRMMSRFRTNLSSDCRSVNDFSEKVLSKYFGSAPSRNRVTRAEKGDLGVHFGMIAAYFNEMKIWPEVLRLLVEGKKPTAHHMMLIHAEINKKNKSKKEHTIKILQERAEKEREYGFYR